jgi:AcrR family transcriptional regulator
MSSSDTPAVEVDPRIVRTRARVLEATAELVGRDGFGRVSIEAISAHSGVARSTIYRHWPRLPLLMMEAARTHGPPLSDPDTGVLADDLVAMFEQLSALLADPAARGMVAGLVAEAHRDDAVAELNRTFSRMRRDRLVACLVRGVRRGELPAGTDVRALATDLAAGFFFRWMIEGEPVDAAFVAHHVERWLALARAGVLTPPAGSAGASPRHRPG